MDKLNTAVIGYGFRGEAVCRNVAANKSYRLEYVCDLKPERLAEARKNLGADVKEEPDYRKLLQDKTVDVVFVLTPQYTHREIAVAALEAGKHVYCEKPMALTIQDCDAIIRASEASNKVLIVGQQMRYHAHLQKIAALIREGAIGRPIMIRLSEFRNPFPETMTWVFHKEKGGGMLMDKSCHHFDMFTWYAGSKPLAVMASGNADVFPRPFGIAANIQDNAFVIVEYENGARAMLHLCMFMGLPYKYECGVGQHVREIMVLGEKGMIRTEGFDLGTDVEMRPNDSRNVYRLHLEKTGCIPDAFNQNGNQGILMDFVECIRAGNKPFASGAIGRAAVAVALAAEKAMAEKRRVMVSEFA